jgi:sulfatase maturation enzyme AslB (radical SAM superfamily)
MMHENMLKATSPYFNSCIYTNEFRPVLCYLFTEWHCNIDCHYCFQYDNHLGQNIFDCRAIWRDNQKLFSVASVPLW